jgi:hypothetical protein
LSDWTHRHVLDLAAFSLADYATVLELAQRFRAMPTSGARKLPALQGRLVTTLFFEPSTRTRSSFELAARRLSADVVSFTPGSSSLSKGESLQLGFVDRETKGVHAGHPELGEKGRGGFRKRCHHGGRVDGHGLRPEQRLAKPHKGYNQSDLRWVEQVVGHLQCHVVEPKETSRQRAEHSGRAEEGKHTDGRAHGDGRP